jgi:hypothetical protein
MDQQHPHGPCRAVALQQHRAADAHGLWGNPGEPCRGKGRIVGVIELLLVRQQVLGKLGALTRQVQTPCLAQGAHDGWQRLDFIGADLHKILQPYCAKGPGMGQSLTRELPRRLGIGKQVVRHRPLRKTVNPWVPLGGQQTVLEIRIGEVGVPVNRRVIP